MNILGSAIFKKYVEDVKNGDILTCQKMKLTVDRHLADLKRKDIYLDYDLIDDIYDFSKKHIKHVTGDIANQPYILEPFQLFIIGSIFGWKKRENDTRRFKKSFIFLARGNAKTDIAAISALYEYYKSKRIGQQIVMLATTKEQAAICFNRAAAMIDISPVLKKIF